MSQLKSPFIAAVRANNGDTASKMRSSCAKAVEFAFPDKVQDHLYIRNLLDRNTKVSTSIIVMCAAQCCVHRV